ncbi:MAG: M20/M25/M40 family metallo-hydrolase [Acidobacteria bacterium]|nr:M20/M25/M40 family metallo-hydrolase [Acidobacteriota bacterium]
MSRRRLAGLGCAVVLGMVAVSALTAAGGGLGSIKSQDLKEWLSYIASDELEGREIYTSGIGLAAAYIEEHARAWGARPAGDKGRYLQTVRVLGVKTTSHATVTVEVNGETRTFADGEGVVFPKNMGGTQRLTLDRVEFAGYGLDAPAAGHMDYKGKDVRKAAVIWLGPNGPKTVDANVYRRLLVARNRYATEQLGAAASVGVAAAAGAGRGGRGAAGPSASGGSGGGRGALPAADFTTVQRLDALTPPTVTADDAFFTFLFSRAPVKYDELKPKAAAQEPLPSFRLDGVRLTFNVEADYQVVRTQLTQNVVALVEGSDAQLKHTYIAFGAHYDHVGYAEGEVDRADGGARRLGAKGRVTPGKEDDRIWNGADDDGSGTVALLALLKAFAEGPHPKRSLVFVWHAGEERGLLGSRYFADYPTVPIDQIVTQLNIDMIGRNRDDKASEANTVYLVGSDRISTELHNLNRSANAALSKPLTLNYEFNDPADLESLYTRSDHYSYAAKGIPIIFFTTGLHPDYHANTDEVSKIEFDKMTRIVQLVYETGLRVANLDHAPARDNLGPRAGRLTQ